MGQGLAKLKAVLQMLNEDSGNSQTPGGSWGKSLFSSDDTGADVTNNGRSSMDVPSTYGNQAFNVRKGSIATNPDNSRLLDVAPLHSPAVFGMPLGGVTADVKRFGGTPKLEAAINNALADAEATQRLEETPIAVRGNYKQNTDTLMQQDANRKKATGLAALKGAK